MRLGLLLLILGCEFDPVDLPVLEAPPSDAGVLDASSPTDTSLMERVGKLEGFAIAGLRYETATQSGHTSEAAEYRYREGEAIRFFVGESVVAEVHAQERLTLLDFADANELRWDNRSIRAAARRRDLRLERLCKLAVLFASLDDDGDPSNGVLLTPELRGITEGRDFEYPLEGDVSSVRHSPRMMPVGDPYRVMMEAQRVFSRPHRVALTAVALDALLRELDIEFSVDAQVVMRVETTDGHSDSLLVRSYGALGYPLTEDSGSGNDERRWHYTYSADGYVSSILTRSGEFLYHPTFDAAGWLLGLDTDDESVVMERDEDGRVERKVRRNAESTHVEIYAYDDEGRLLLWERSVDGVVIQSEAHTYEPGLHRTTGNGFITDVRFDENGHWVSLEQHHEGSRSLTTARRNREGRIVGQLQRTENHQGSQTWVECFGIDHPQGSDAGTVTYTFDDECDGDLERVVTTRFSETGQKIDEHTVDGSESRWRRYIYDGNDNLILSESDQRRESYEYEESGLGAVYPEDVHSWDS